MKKSPRGEKRIRKKGKRGMFIFLSAIILAIIFVYAVSWAMSFRPYKAEWGISFNHNHASYLGLDWKETYTAMLDELKPRHVRIAAMWNEGEPEPGVYQFDSVDWMMVEAAKRNVKVVLVVGQKAPRWPECHIPDWAKGKIQESKPAYLAFVSEVVRRYKLHPALDTWQIENEPFIRFDFGECTGYDPAIVYDGVAVVKAEDSRHPIMITDSGELNIWWKSTRIGDVFGTTIYRIVRAPTGHRFTYAWLPPGLYKIRARLLGRPYDKFYVSELQGEPWFHKGDPMTTPTEEQEETMNPKILQKNIHYAERVGATRIYLWGVEWWYYMKTVRGDARYWEVVKAQFGK